LSAAPVVVGMTVSRVVELEGHIIDSGMMQSVFGIVMDHGGFFDVEEFGGTDTNTVAGADTS
jgi:hypothetical protein